MQGSFFCLVKPSAKQESIPDKYCVIVRTVDAAGRTPQAQYDLHFLQLTQVRRS